jgi:hypothetical protein
MYEQILSVDLAVAKLNAALRDAMKQTIPRGYYRKTPPLIFY